MAAFYVHHKQAPFGPTDAQATELRTAAATAAAATDVLLQMRLALKTAAQGTTPADLNQARLDAVAAAELIPRPGWPSRWRATTPPGLGRPSTAQS